MIGLSAISAHNGWAMVFVGISIVFSGLVFLSFAVSRIKKILPLWEKRVDAGEWQRDNPLQEDAANRQVANALPREMETAARQVKILIDRMGEPFSLVDLRKMAQAAGLKQTVIMLEKMVEKDLILPDEGDRYIWNSSAIDSVLME